MIYTQESTDLDGVVTITAWDLDTSTVTVTVDGVVTVQRPMSPAEITYWQPHAATREAEANVSKMTTESAEAVDKLILVIENLNAITAMTNASINQNPAATIKAVARELKTVARQVNREARMTSGETDDTYTGPEGA